MSRLLITLSLVPLAVLNAAAPALDPLPDVAARLARDPGDAAALRALVALAGTDGDAASPDEPGLRVGNALRTRLLLRRTLADQPRTRAAVAKGLLALGRSDPSVVMPLLVEAADLDILLAFAADTTSTPAAELLLQTLTRSPDRSTRGRAVLALARLRTRAGLLRDAAALYDRIGQDHARDAIDGKVTGADVVAEARSDKRLLPFFGETVEVLPRAYSVRETAAGPGSFPCVLSPVGDVPPSLIEKRLAIDHAGGSLWIQDRGGETYRQVPSLGPTQFIEVLRRCEPARPAAFVYQPLGPLVFFSLGDRAFGVDAVKGRTLWQRELLGSRYSPIAVDARPDGAARVRYGDGASSLLDADLTAQLLGVPLPLTTTCLVVPARDRLLGLDPLTGLVLWAREGEKSGSLLLHDDLHVHVVRQDEKGTATSTASYRLADGRKGDVKDFAALFNRSMARVGGRLLIADTDGVRALSLRLVNPTTGRDVWSLWFAKGGLFVDSVTPDLTGVMEPDGTFHLIEATTGRKLWARSIPSEGSWTPSRVQAVRLMADHSRVFLAIEEAVKKDDTLTEGWQPLVSRASGLRAVPVNGPIHAFLRASGKHRWSADATGQMMLVGPEAATWPVVVFAARRRERAGFIAGGGGTGASGGVVFFDRRRLEWVEPPSPRIKGRFRFEWTRDEIRAIHKHHGKLMYDNQVRAGGAPVASAIRRIDAAPDGSWVRVWCERNEFELIGRVR